MERQEYDASAEAPKLNEGEKIHVRSVIENGDIAGFKLVSLVSALTSAALLVLLDASIIAPAIPRITSQFHSLSDVAWYGSSYQLTSASFQPLTGSLYTYFNIKWTFLAFLGVFELGSLVCAIASSSKMLIVARAIAGVGASGIQNGALTIIARALPVKKQARMRHNTLIWCRIYGPWLILHFDSHDGDRVGGVIFLAMLFVTIPELKVVSDGLSALQIIRELDLIGFFIFAPAMIQLLLTLDYGGNQYSWNSATVIGLFLWIVRDVFYLSGMGVPHRCKGYVSSAHGATKNSFFFLSLSFFLGGVTACASYYLPLYFQAVKGVSPMMSGVYLLPNIISQLVCVIFAGALGKTYTPFPQRTFIDTKDRKVGKLGYYLPFGIATGGVSSIGNGLVSLFSPSTSTGTWIGYQILLGAGRGIGLQSPMIAVQNTVSAAQISVALSLLMFSQTMDQAIFLTLAQAIFFNSLKSALGVYAPFMDSGAVVAAGAGATHMVVSKDKLAGVLVAYSQGIDYVFYLATGTAIGCFCVAWGMGWKDTRKRERAMSLAQLMNVVARAVIEEPVACHSLVCSAEPGMRTTSPTARVGVRSSGCFPRDSEAAPWETNVLAASFPLTWCQLMRWS
ncbi:hypothetical protein N7449_004981 [Penicillium cf. viridicatum]|uniref:Major facilitator superfamily (MFS) profile domain-containing protein n=1 Tax=Penicillium cf. viridicatum TaxID=2972119 RepID=A0A9W9MKD6_9EURO|nr:hypothetical protein N7449_004981 [Penicillium cf. viridicatum]